MLVPIRAGKDTQVEEDDYLDEYNSLDERTASGQVEGLPAPIDREELGNAQSMDWFCREVLEEKAAKNEESLESSDGILMQRQPTDPSRSQIIVPESFRGRLLNLMHRSRLEGHSGQRRMI